MGDSSTPEIHQGVRLARGPPTAKKKPQGLTSEEVGYIKSTATAGPCVPAGRPPSAKIAPVPSFVRASGMTDLAGCFKNPSWCYDAARGGYEIHRKEIQTGRS